MKGQWVNCAYCGTRFKKRTEHHRHCSTGCRNKYSRASKGIPEPEFLKKKEPSINKSIERKEQEFKTKFNLSNSSGFQLRSNSEEITILNNNKLYWQRVIEDAYKGVFPTWTVSLGLGGLSVGETGEQKFIGALIGVFIGNAMDKEREEKKYLKTESVIIEANRQINAIDKRIKELRKQEKEFIKPLQKENILSQPSSTGLISVNTDELLSLDELKGMKFETLEFKDEYKELFGNPQPNFLLTIYGSPGHGKTTWSVKFAEYLANNHGRVLFNSSEEGFRASLQNKVKALKSSYLHFSDCRTFEELKKLIKKNPSRFIFIDSINDMKITPEQLQQLRNENPKKGIVIIMQATKDGKFKGANEYAHDSDINVRIENREPILEKSRFL